MKTYNVNEIFVKCNNCLLVNKFKLSKKANLLSTNISKGICKKCDHIQEIDFNIIQTYYQNLVRGDN